MDLAGRRLTREVVGYDLNPAARRAALRMRAVHRAPRTLEDAVREADLVVLAAPVRAILKLLAEMASHLRRGTVVLDVGSTKCEIVRAMDRLPRGISAVGGHPMAGVESPGIAAARRGLFAGRAFFLVPSRRTKPVALSLSASLARAIGARPVKIGAVEHDRVVALLSHVPYVLSLALVEAAARASAGRSDLAPLVGGSFLGATRVARSDPRMMGDALTTNRGNVAGALRALARIVGRYERRLRRASDRELLEDLERAYSAAALLRGGNYQA